MKSKLTRVLPAVAIASVIALSASTGAVAAGMITGADIKNNSVASADIKNKSVTGKDVKDGALTAADLSTATLGDLKGATGPAGAAGAAGAPGVSGLVQVEVTSSVAPSDSKTLVVSCPAGKKILGLASDWTNTFLLTSSERFNPDLTGGEAFGFNDTASSKTLRASAICGFVS